MTVRYDFRHKGEQEREQEEDQEQEQEEDQEQEQEQWPDRLLAEKLGAARES